jgi:hypothetical protein
MTWLRVLLAWLTRLPARQADPPSALRPPEALARAVATCGYRCLECQTTVIALHYAPALGWIPTVRHWPVGPGEWCPVLGSGVLLELESLDLLDALAARTTLASYGEPVWHAREMAAAAA